MLPVGSVDDRDPLTCPGEGGGLCDRHEPEISLREPLPEEPDRLGIARGFRSSNAEELAEAVLKIAGYRDLRIRHVIFSLDQKKGPPRRASGE